LFANVPDVPLQATADPVAAKTVSQVKSMAKGAEKFFTQRKDWTLANEASALLSGLLGQKEVSPEVTAKVEALFSKVKKAEREGVKATTESNTDAQAKFARTRAAARDKVAKELRDKLKEKKRNKENQAPTVNVAAD
jgi:hypothetical protein